MSSLGLCGVGLNGQRAEFAVGGDAIVILFADVDRYTLIAATAFLARCLDVE